MAEKSHPAPPKTTQPSASSSSTSDIIQRLDQARKVAERVLVLEQELARERAVLQSLTGQSAGAVAGRMGKGGGPSLLEMKTETARDTNFGLSHRRAGGVTLSEQVRLAIEQHPGQEMTARDIRALIKTSQTVQRVSEILNHIAKKSPRVRRVRHGVYVFSPN